MRGIPAKVLIVTVIVAVAAVSRATADEIVITGGLAIGTGFGSSVVGTVDLHGTQGFSAELGLAWGDITGPWRCFPCDPGTPISLNTFISSSDGGGAVQLHGVSYPVPSSQADILIGLSGGPVIAPPLSTSAVLSAPFEVLRGSAAFLFDFQGEPTVRFPLVGRGFATLHLSPDTGGAPAWDFAGVRYDFLPTPEPASLLLVGTGMLAWAAHRHRRLTRLRKSVALD